MASRAPLSYPRFQLLDSNGKPIPNGTVEFFDAGTTNNRDVYSDASLSTTLPNPVTLNSRGEPETGGGTATDIYLDSNPYKIVAKDANSATIWTIDNYIADLVGPSNPQDPANATDSGTDTFQASLNADPTSGETLQIDFQSANTTTTPTFENTSGSLGALTIKTRDGSALWSGALNGAHELYYDGTDLLVLDPETTMGVVDPEHATDSGTDAYVSATNTTAPAAGVTITRDFQSANTTTTPTLDSKTVTDRDGNALWAGAINGGHELQYASGTDTYLLLDPRPTSANVNNAPVSRNSTGRFKASDPQTAQDVVTKIYLESQAAIQIQAKTTATSVSEVDIDISGGAYSRVVILFHAHPVNDGVDFVARLQAAANSSPDSGASDYGYYSGRPGTAVGRGSSSESEIRFNADANVIGTAPGEGCHGQIIVGFPRDSGEFTHVHVTLEYRDASGNARHSTTGGRRNASQDDDLIRLFFNSGNIDSITYEVWGYLE